VIDVPVNYTLISFERFGVFPQFPPVVSVGQIAVLISPFAATPIYKQRFIIIAARPKAGVLVNGRVAIVT
jgi:hypothetical protein